MRVWSIFDYIFGVAVVPDIYVYIYTIIYLPCFDEGSQKTKDIHLQRAIFWSRMFMLSRNSCSCCFHMSMHFLALTVACVVPCGWPAGRLTGWPGTGTARCHSAKTRQHLVLRLEVCDPQWEPMCRRVWISNDFNLT